MKPRTFPYCSVYRLEFRGCGDLFVIAADVSQAVAAGEGYALGRNPEAVMLKAEAVVDFPLAIIDGTGLGESA